MKHEIPFSQNIGYFGTNKDILLLARQLFPNINISTSADLTNLTVEIKGLTDE